LTQIEKKKLEFMATNNNTTTTTSESGLFEVKDIFNKARELNDSFFYECNQETEKKSLLFVNLRNKIKTKTEESIKKIIENESKILTQVTNLEAKFIELFELFVKYERNAETNLNKLENQLSLLTIKSNDQVNNNNSLLLRENIKNELINLENYNLKFKQLLQKETDLETNNDFKIDESFLNKLIEKNNIFLKECLEYQNLNNNKTTASTTSATISTSTTSSKCGKCGLDLSGTYNIFNEKKYHSYCFLCCQCDLEILENVFYTNNDTNDIKPLCRVCFNLNLVDKASQCFKCQQPILDTLINFKNNQFHDYCLICESCNKSLIGEAIYSDKLNKPFCIDCFTKREAKQCAICLQLIVPNQISFLFESKNFHKG